MTESFTDSSKSISGESLIIERTDNKTLIWVALFFGGFSIFGPLYTYVLPVSLETPIESVMNINDATYNLLYTLGGAPSLFMPIIGGYLTDRLGCRLVLFFGLTMILLGQSIMALGAFQDNFTFLVLGRFVSMAFIDTMYIARYKMICNLFYEKNIAIAIGVAVTFNKLATITNGFVTPYIDDNTGSIGMAWIAGIITVFASWISGLVFIFLDIKIHRNRNNRDIKTNDVITSRYEPKIKDILKLHKVFWLVAICGALGFGTYDCLQFNLDAFLQRKFGYSLQAADEVSTVFMFTSLIVMIIMTVFIENYGMRALVILVSSCTMTLSIVLFQLFQPCAECYSPILPLVIFGFFLGTYNTSNYASAPFLIRKELLGLAFGIMAFLTNLITVILPIIFGIIVDSDEINGVYSYTWALIYLLIFAVLSLIFAILVYSYDIKLGRPLSQLKPNDTYKLDKENVEDI